MQSAATFLGSTIGKKVVMALTGVVLVGFVFAHMTGNLQLYLGPETMNAYGRLLHELGHGAALWIFRSVLLVCVGLHVWAATSLTLQSRAARPVGYRKESWTESTYASRTMMMSGLIVAAFIIYHLLHFTVQTQTVNLTGKSFLDLTDAKGRHDVFAMMVMGFRQPVVACFYLFAMALLCLHLSHGISALIQSLGLKPQAWGPCIDRCAVWIAWAIFVGYSSIPIAILLGYGNEAAK